MHARVCIDASSWAKWPILQSAGPSPCIGDCLKACSMHIACADQDTHVVGCDTVPRWDMSQMCPVPPFQPYPLTDHEGTKGKRKKPRNIS